MRVYRREFTRDLRAAAEIWKGPAFVRAFGFKQRDAGGGMKFASGTRRPVIVRLKPNAAARPIVVAPEWTARSLRPTRSWQRVRALQIRAEPDFYYRPLLSSRRIAIVGVGRGEMRLSLCKMLETFSRDCSRESGTVHCMYRMLTNVTWYRANLLKCFATTRVSWINV